MSILWDERFLSLAGHIAGWSKDPSTKVGAVIVNDKRIIMGVGYNGFPRGVDDSPEAYADRELKHRMVVHAEANAILNARGSVEGCTLYVTLPPCSECAKLLIQSGISKVIALYPGQKVMERWGDSFHTAGSMLIQAGVKVHWTVGDVT